MKIQTKTMILLLSTMGVLIFFIFILQYIGLKQNEIFLQESITSQELVIDQVLSAKSEKYILFSKDNSAWDEMVKFFQSKDSAWALNNVDYAIESFHLSFVAIFDSTGSLYYSKLEEKPKFDKIPLSETELKSAFSSSPYCHFYKLINDSLFEFFGAIIVPSSDIESRSLKPSGYLLLCKHWDSTFISELKTASNFDVSIHNATEKVTKQKNKNTKIIENDRLIKDALKNNVATIRFSKPNPVAKDLNVFMYITIVVSIVFLVALIIFFFIFRRWVTKPLKQISNTLDLQKVDYIKQLEIKRDEFGQIAHLIKNFFKQKDDLLEINALLQQQKEEISVQNEVLHQQKEEILVQSEQLLETQERIELINRDLQYQTLALDASASVVITDSKGNITYVNSKFVETSGYSKEELIGQNNSLFKSGEHNQDFYSSMWKTISIDKKIWRNEVCNKAKNGTYYWEDATIVPFLDDENNVYQFLAIRFEISQRKIFEKQIQNQNHELITSKGEIERKNNAITDSISYARYIQTALLSNREVLSSCFSDNFILYHPKDIVSGDFYFFKRVDNLIMIAVADCTGHGVPGAFMSMLGITFLNEVARQKNVLKTNLILEDLREFVKTALGQTGKRNEMHDGMDMALCIINMETLRLYYSGANIALLTTNMEACKYYCEIPVAKVYPDKMPIGIYAGIEKKFNTQSYQLKKGDCIYLCTDGFQDQMGGPSGRKYLAKNLRKLFENISTQSMEDQKSVLEQTLTEWRIPSETNNVSYKQMDDITIVGFRV